MSDGFAATLGGVTAVVLALLSGLAYGVSDYVGGRASRHRSPLVITLTAEVCLTVVIVIVVPLVEGPFPDDARVWWGTIGGLGGTLGVLGLYRALSSGSMTVVAPITGVVAAVLPIGVGLALGERPGPAVGIGVAIALVAVALVGGIVGALHQPLATGVVMTAIGVGALFGLLFVAFSRTGETGLWPLLTARAGSLPLLVAFYAFARHRELADPVDRGALVPGLTIGVLISVANGLYLVSTREGLLAVVAVLVSLYPAATVGLAMAIDHERVTRWQVLGMGLAAVGVALIAGAA